MPEFNLLVSDWYHVDADTTDLMNPFIDGGAGDVFHFCSYEYGPDGVPVGSMKYVSSLINGYYN